MTTPTDNKGSPPRGLAALPLVLRIVIAVMLMALGLFQARKAIYEFFPSLGADSEVTVAARKAVAAGDGFLGLTKDVYRTGAAPRASDPTVGPLLDALFDTHILQKAHLTKADIDNLASWGITIVKVGSVYVLAGTGVADFTKVPSDPVVIQRTNANVITYAPEIGRYVDAQLLISGVWADVLANDMSASGVDDSPTVKEGKAKIRAGITETISGVINTIALDGVRDDWRRARLPALASVALGAAKIVTPDQCRQLHQTSRVSAAAMTDAQVQQGLEGFATALKC